MRERLPQALPDWNAVKLLEVTVDRLESWSCKGMLCIGDAAHAMSPVGGVGINLAVQDAVAAANLLAPALAGTATDKQIDTLLPQLQRRREWPVRVTQAAQRMVQNRVLMPVLGGKVNTRRGMCRGRCGCCRAGRGCAGCRRARWAWGCGRSTCVASGLAPERGSLCFVYAQA
jgi:2-polyprenyl-6-methoxyphenol hydroxylase-like FAD-dependent oxidoreductase